jgi:peptidoglycan/LPS O-acetylase OafA/YrhL
VERIELAREERNYIDLLRGASILRVVLAHLGLSWFFLPYSSYIGLLLPVLFFVSGVVNYNSYLRAKSEGRLNYKILYRKIKATTVPFYLLGLMITIACLPFFSSVEWRPAIFGWLLVKPNTEGLGFSLAQAWFLQALVIAHLVLYLIIRFSASLIVMGIVFILSIGLLVTNTVIGGLHELLYIGPVDFYTGLTYMAIYLYGPVYFLFLRNTKSSYLWSINLVLLVIFVFLLIVDANLSLVNNKTVPDILYFSGALLLINLLMMFRPLIQGVVVNKLKLNAVLLFASKHSFSIYLLHTIVLGGVEYLFFPEALTGQPAMALVRLLLVVVITVILAPVYTKIYKFFLR